MKKLITYYKSVLDRALAEGNKKLSDHAYYLNALAFIEREAVLVEQKGKLAARLDWPLKTT